MKKTISRRSILKGSAAIAGATAVTGFPTVWAQALKDVTIMHTGMSYSTLADIGKQASKDLGFKVEMSVVDHPGLTNRMVNDPKSIDVARLKGLFSDSGTEIMAAKWKTKSHPATAVRRAGRSKMEAWMISQFSPARFSALPERRLSLNTKTLFSGI